MKNKITLGYDDISIVPERITNIRHRQKCFCYDANLSLPIFAAPMDNVVNIDSAKILSYHKIHSVIPRTISLEERINQIFEVQLDKRIFFAFSLSEAQDFFLKNLDGYNYTNYLIGTLRKKIENDKSFVCRICIDIANGHMIELIDVIKSIKEKYGRQVIIMSGNIANPETYKFYEDAGCDFVRCSIGSGSRCTTSSNVAVHYGCFSLLKEIWEIKQQINGKCKIIADGGIKGYGDIQKALLYADYVMIGGLFNKAIDSAGTPIYGRFYWNFFGEKILNPFKTLFYYGKKVKECDYEKVLKMVKNGKVDVWKEYYGMSTKIAQSKINPGGILKTGEGKIERQKVEYSIKQWVENEIDFLRSAMSYTNSKTLEEYKNSNWVQLTYKSYNK
jgi:IMP dehydrogenase/GMP reductase